MIIFCFSEFVYFNHNNHLITTFYLTCSEISSYVINMNILEILLKLFNRKLSRTSVGK